MFYQFHPREFSQNFPLQLWLFGENHLQELIYRPQGVPYYQWFYCVKGQGELITNHQRSIISKGEGFLVHSETEHMYQGLTKDWTLHVVGFNGSLCSEILSALQMSASCSYHFSDSTVFEKHIQNLKLIYKDSPHNQALSYSKECYDFLLDLSQCITHTHELSYSQDNDIVLKVISYLERNYMNPISLDTIASLLNLSKDYMCALFKKATGQTIIGCLTSIRMGHARQYLIQYPERKVLDIAKMCGFESPSYFGKIFKKELGITPEGYRKST